MSLIPTTWNPQDKGSACTLSNDNLTATGRQSNGAARSTFGASSGKWYWELTSTGSRYPIVGVATASASINDYPGADANGWSYYGYDSAKINAGTQTSYGSAWASSSDVIGVALDMDAGTLTFYKNGVSMGVAFTGISGTVYAMTGGDTDTGGPSNVTANFGATSFAYSPPIGHNAGFGAIPSSRYWRITAIDPYERGDLALSEIGLYAGGVRADSPGMLTASIAPTSGSLSHLSNGSNAEVVKWSRSAYSASGFSLLYDLGTAWDVDEFRLGAGDLKAEFPFQFAVECLTAANRWSDTTTNTGVVWPGASGTASITVPSGAGTRGLATNGGVIPELASPYPSPAFGTALRLPSIHYRLDYRGDGQIIDTVKNTGSPSNIPVRRHVFCMDMLSGTIVADTWSDAATGVYAFYNLDRSRKYTVFSYDHTLFYRATIADSLTPEKMP